jgi:Tol biopolymer transport system component
MERRNFYRLGLLAVLGCTRRELVVGFENEAAAVDAGAPFGAPVLVTGLLDATDEIQDPSLSQDELEIYFASLKNGTYDIWMSTRVAIGAPWVPGVLVPELSTASADYEPNLSYDGLTMYLSSNRPDAENLSISRIWVSERQSPSDLWGVPQLVNLGATSADRSPAVDVRGLLMVFAADHGTNDFDLYRSNRETPTATWGLPVNIAEINSPVFDWEPDVYNSGLGLVFASRRNGDQTTSHLFETTRATEATPFDTPQPLVQLNSTSSEGTSWLSNDGRYIIFSSTRSGLSQLYEAWR